MPFDIQSCEHSGTASDCKSRGRVFEAQPGRINFEEIDHEILSYHSHFH